MKKNRFFPSAPAPIIAFSILALMQAAAFILIEGCEKDHKSSAAAKRSQARARVSKPADRADAGPAAAEKPGLPVAEIQKIEKRTKSSSARPQKQVKIRSADLYATVQIILVSKQGEFIDSRLEGAIDVIKAQLDSQTSVDMKELREATNYSLYKQIRLKIKKGEEVPVVLPNGKRVTLTNLGLKGRNPQIAIKSGKYNKASEIKQGGLVFGGIRYNNSHIILFIKAEEAG
jgi:hypothetical protein